MNRVLQTRRDGAMLPSTRYGDLVNTEPPADRVACASSSIVRLTLPAVTCSDPLNQSQEVPTCESHSTATSIAA